VKSLKNSNAPPRDNSRIDRRSFALFSHYAQLMRLTRSTHCHTPMHLLS